MQLTRLAFPNPQITNLKNGQSQKQSLQGRQTPGAKDFVTFGAGPSASKDLVDAGDKSVEFRLMNLLARDAQNEVQIHQLFSQGASIVECLAERTRLDRIKRSLLRELLKNAGIGVKRNRSSASLSGGVSKKRRRGE